MFSARSKGDMMALSAMTMKRIEACAWIAASDKQEKIKAIAEATGNNTLDAAKMYIIGALKAGIRRGTYRTYSDALDALEREQVGDRGESIGALNELERTVRRINHINAKPSTAWEIELMGSKEVTEKKRHDIRNMAKVYGSLYVQWLEREDAGNVEYIYETAEHDAQVLKIDSTIRSYIHEYIGRLSPTACKAIRAIVESAYSADAIASAKDGDGYALRNKLNYLHRGFPKRDAISPREFAHILKRYA